MRSRAHYFAVLCFLAICLLANPWAWGTEFGLDFHPTNLHFPWDEESPLAPSIANYPADNFVWSGEAWIRQALGKHVDIRISYELDPVLRNLAIVELHYEHDIFGLSVGPMIGFLNSDAAPVSGGLSASLQLRWPGVLFVRLRLDNGFPIELPDSGFDAQSRIEGRLGFYLPHVIVQAVGATKRFTCRDSGGNTITDFWFRYGLETDIFAKNIPFTALLSLVYEQRSKYFASAGLTDSLGSLVLGTRFTFQVIPALNLSLSMSASLYTVGMDNLVDRGPAPGAFLFQAGLGFTLNIDPLIEAKKQRARIRSMETLPAEEPAP